jgi:hypothetical protein
MIPDKSRIFAGDRSLVKVSASPAMPGGRRKNATPHAESTPNPESVSLVGCAFCLCLARLSMPGPALVFTLC